jgi:hypothetical protein
MVHDQDMIGITDSGESMRYNERRAPFGHLKNRLLYQSFRFGINARGGLIEYENLRLIGQGSGKGQKLTFACRKG